MASGAWHGTSRRVQGLLGALLPVALIACRFFGVAPFLDRAHGGEEARGGAPATSGDAAKEADQQRLDDIRRRNQATKVYRLDDGKRNPVNPLPDPLFRYSDHPRKILDGTLWAWGTQGRPIALQKIEFYRRSSKPWTYCFASLSEGLLEAEWPDGHRWSAKKPGLELHALPDGPTPADSPFRRLLQIKNLARRFSSRAIDPLGPWEEQQWLLPQPVHRYSDPDAGLQDAAIFAFATNGTNPDLLLFLELHGEDLSDSVWKYSLNRMTDGGLKVRFDQKEVWSAPYVWPDKIHDTWLYFESR
jgi:hypothetical protein